MKTGFRLLHGCAAMLASVTLLQLLALTASLGGSRGQVLFLFPVWAAAGLISLAVNQLMFWRGVPVPALAAVNAGLLAAALAALLLTAPVLEGPFGYLLGIGLPIVSQGQAIYYAWTPPVLQAQLTRLDGALACAAWALLLSAGKTDIGSLLFFLPALLILNVVCAVALRVSADDGEGSLLCGAPVRGGLFAAGAAALLILLVLGLTRLFGGGSRAAVSGFFLAAKTAWLTLWHGIEAFFAWLLSFFPASGPLEPPLPTGEAAGSAYIPDGAAEAMFPLLPVLAVFLAAAIAVLLIFLIIRLRRTRLRLPLRSAPAPAGGQIRRKRKTGALSRRWAALLAGLRFRLLALRYRSTPPGLLVWLENWGKRHRQPRKTGEPIRAYLLRLDGGGSLLPLADALDARYYGSGGTLAGGQCRRLRRDFLRRRHKSAVGTHHRKKS